MSKRRSWLPPHFDHGRPVIVGVASPPSPPSEVQRNHRIVAESMVQEIGLYARLRVDRDVSQALRAIGAVASALDIGFMLADGAAVNARSTHYDLAPGLGKVAVEIAPDAIHGAVDDRAEKFVAVLAQLRHGPRHGAGGLWLAAEVAEGIAMQAGWQACGRRPGPAQAINKWIAENSEGITRLCPWVGALPSGNHPRDLMKAVADARRSWRAATTLRHDIVNHAGALMLGEPVVGSLKFMAMR